jgi:hypothetical protein
MVKTPRLYRFASERRFHEVLTGITEQTEDIYWADHYGSTALHILCQVRQINRTLLEAVEAIVQHDPSLIGLPNQSTCTPLHYAAEKRLIWGTDGTIGATELVLILLKYYPQAVLLRTRTGIKAGKTPFHIACEANADARVLKAMLMIHPGLATEPFVKKDVYSIAENPLQILWSHESNHRNNNNTREKMALLVRAAHYGTIDDAFHQDSKIRLVSAACSVRCPQQYFLQLLQQHEDQVYELDEPRNLLPLHYAVLNASVDSQPYTQFVLESLLDYYPEAAAVPDEQGRLPLHVALMDSKLTWHKGGIQELVYAYPSALGVLDPVHQMLPFLASACHAIESMLHLSTTYELLRAAPDVIETVVSNYRHRI